MSWHLRIICATHQLTIFDKVKLPLFNRGTSEFTCALRDGDNGSQRDIGYPHTGLACINRPEFMASVLLAQGQTLSILAKGGWDAV